MASHAVHGYPRLGPPTGYLHMSKLQEGDEDEEGRGEHGEGGGDVKGLREEGEVANSCLKLIQDNVLYICVLYIEGL